MDIYNRLLINFQDMIIAAVPDANDKSGIRECSQDLGQIDIEGMPPAVAFPWLGVDFSNTTYEQLQFNQQRGRMQISLRLAFDPYSSESSLAPAEVREKALKYYSIEQKIYKAISNWRCPLDDEATVFLLVTGLRRVSAKSENRKDTLRVRQLVYEATFIDDSLNES